MLERPRVARMILSTSSVYAGVAGRALRSTLLLAALALGVAASACSSSSTNGTPPGGALTCQNGASPGPESVECDTCGAANCASLRADVTTPCGTYVACLQACQCTSSDTCSSGCFNAASSACQAAANAYADCEKQTAACSSDCSD